MADNWIMGRIKWLFLFFICFSSRNVFCDLSLKTEPTVTGVRSLSVLIPCTYTASKDYEEVKVEWSLASEIIIHRIDSEDHIPLVKFRERVEISKSPGDVSLTIRKLSFSDKGDIKCKVTWKKYDGTLISKEEISILSVLRVKPKTEKPKENIITTTYQQLETMKPTTGKTKENIIATTYQELETTNSESPLDIFATEEPDFSTMKPTTEKLKENISTATYQEFETTNSESPLDIIATEGQDFSTMKPTTDKPTQNIITTTHQDLKTTMPDKLHDATILPEVSTKLSHFDDSFHVSTVRTTEGTELGGFLESTTVIPWHTSTILYTNTAIPQSKVFGIPLYILIAIIICALCITTVVIVLIMKRKKRKESIYELPTMNQLLASQGARDRCQSSAYETSASNNYEQYNPPPELVYEGIVLPFSNEYELLIVENKPENNCP